jgi:hypothetical protein
MHLFRVSTESVKHQSLFGIKKNIFCIKSNGCTVNTGADLDYGLKHCVEHERSASRLTESTHEPDEPDFLTLHPQAGTRVSDKQIHPHRKKTG